MFMNDKVIILLVTNEIIFEIDKLDYVYTTKQICLAR